MRKLNPVPQEPSPDPVSLAAAAVNSLIQTLPAGTAFFIGIVLIVMMTGRLVQTKGSLTRAALPFVLHLRWGWHRVERAMERGKFSLDAFLDRAYGLGFYQVTQPLVPLTHLSENPLNFFGSFSARLHPAQVPQIFPHAGPNNWPIGHQTGRASGPMARSPAVHRPPQWPSTATRLSAPH